MNENRSSNERWTRTKYVYDGSNIQAELNADGSLGERYTYGPTIDEPLVGQRQPKIFYYEADGLGSITSLTDPTGATAATYTYDSFGFMTKSTGNATNWRRYTAREFDSNTGLYYYRARYYDPQIGRFVSEDPIRFKGGVNFYAYISGNPVSRIDPFGLAGTLTIYSYRGTAGESSWIAGHSWISFTPDGGTPTTYSTWGNQGILDGLNLNYDMYSSADASRTTHLNDVEQAALIATIMKYSNMGQKGWSDRSNCSKFASDAWQAATGETLSPGSVLPTPIDLTKSIVNANGGQANGTLVQGGGR